MLKQFLEIINFTIIVLFFFSCKNTPENYDNMVFIRHKNSSFYIDKTEVTNEQFQKFVKETGYITSAEKEFKVKDENRKEIKLKGSLVFNQPNFKVNPNALSWWGFTEGADWKHPSGPKSSIKGLENHPVVHVSWEDANAYAVYYKKRLPTVEEWEIAFKQSNDQINFSEINIWQGEFPYKNNLKDGFFYTSPVKSFLPNSNGIYDLSGNVWEWCKVDDFFNLDEAAMKGGSFLCSDSYCSAYKNLDTSFATKKETYQHVGFRCVAD